MTADTTNFEASEAQNAAASTAADAPKSKKKPTVYTEVELEDGRKAKFAGTRKMQKSYEETPEGVKATFDFVNGATRSIVIGPDSKLIATLVGHGLVQKIGDETATTSDVDDMVLEVEAMIERLQKGEFYAERAAGDGFSGASVVLKALVEVTGLSLEAVKANIEKKLAATEGLTRKALYDSFRNPNSKTGVVIARLEQEKLAKSAKIDADAELASWA
jgi:hypothetical protein